MAITPVTANMNIIQLLDDEPNDVDGLTAAQLKAKFDEGGIALKNYINNTLIPQLEVIAANAEKMSGVTVATALGSDNTTVPTSRAVRDALIIAGSGDMAKEVYDTSGRETDIFGYVDTAVAGRAAASHNHTRADISDFPSAMTPATHASSHGTGGTDAITPASIGAAATGHTHAGTDITSGTVPAERLPVIPVTKGGTGAETAAQARTNLGAAAPTSAALAAMLSNGATVLSANQYGDTLPATGTQGQIFFRKA